MNKTQKVVLSIPHVLILQLLVSFVVVLALAIAPALPSMSIDLAISKEATQLIISVYLIGFAIGHLLYGPLANRFGRKPVLLTCLAFSALSSLGCLAAGTLHSFILLLFFRLVMALAASGTLKLSYNIAADLLIGSHLTRMSSYFIISFAVAPPIGIFISGFLAEHWGYQSIFVFLLLYSALLFLFTLSLPETHLKKELNGLNLFHIAKKYIHCAQESVLIIGSFILGCAVAAIYLFGSEAPFISENIIGLSPKGFGTMTLVPYLGMLLGGIFSAIVSHRLSAYTVLVWGTLISIIFSLIMTVFFCLHIITLSSLFLPLAGIFLGVGLICSNIISLSLSHSKDKSYGSAILNFITSSLSVIAVLLIAALSSLSILAYPLILLALALIGIALVGLIKKYAVKQ